MQSYETVVNKPLGNINKDAKSIESSLKAFTIELSNICRDALSSANLFELLKENNQNEQMLLHGEIFKDFENCFT